MAEVIKGRSWFYLTFESHPAPEKDIIIDNFNVAIINFERKNVTLLDVNTGAVHLTSSELFKQKVIAARKNRVQIFDKMKFLAAVKITGRAKVKIFDHEQNSMKIYPNKNFVTIGRENSTVEIIDSDQRNATIKTNLEVVHLDRTEKK